MQHQKECESEDRAGEESGHLNNAYDSCNFRGNQPQYRGKCDQVDGKPHQQVAGRRREQDNGEGAAAPGEVDDAPGENQEIGRKIEKDCKELFLFIPSHFTFSGGRSTALMTNSAS
jgi:hypothetical protein